MVNYTGNSDNTVTSSYLFSQFQLFFDKIKGLLNKKSDEGHTHSSLEPLMSHSYSGIYATENNFAKGTFYFGTVLPDDYNVPWRIKYRINSSVDGQTAYGGNFTVELIGSRSSRIASKIFNAHTSTSARSIYYHVQYTATSTGIANGYGHALGVGLRNSSNPTSSSYQRSFDIDILEIENCTFTFLDTMTLYANLLGTGSTNYNGYAEHDGCNNGLQETGDNNQYNRLLNSEVRLYAGSNKIFPYTLIMEKSDGKWESLVLYSSQATTKSKNTSGFRPESIYYYSSSATVASGSATATWTVYEGLERFDLRWSTNCGTTLTQFKPVYLKGTMENGLFYLADTWYTQTLPTSNDGYVYILLGTAVANYQITLNTSHPMYVYRNGYVQEYVGNAETVNGHTVLSNVPANAKFTDTTYSNATATKSGLMSYEDKIKLDTVETGANNYELPVATKEDLGGVQLGYTQSGKNYPLQVDENKAFVSVPWENTWRPVQNNLTSSSTSDSLSAYQGKVLKGLVDAKAPSGGSTSISKLASSVTLGDGNAASISQSGGNYNQKISIHDNSTSGDEVFKFQQSSDAGKTFQDLMVINDDSSVVAQTFVGDLTGTAMNASMLGGLSLGSGQWGTIPQIRKYDGVMEVGKYIDFHNDTSVSNDYDARITSNGTGLTLSGTTQGTFKGNLTGTATNATSDAKGNNIANTYIKDLTVVDNALVMTNGAGTSVDVMDLPTVGTTSNLGLTKLYTGTGSNTDGSMTQKAITTALSGKSDTSHNHDSAYLSLANGGTVEGLVNFKKGSFVHAFSGNSNTSGGGYMHIAQFVVKASYINSPIVLTLTKRSGYGQVIIRFNNDSSKDPSVNYLRYNGVGNILPFMVKSATSTWDLYIKATESYDGGKVIDYYNPYHAAGDTVSVTWKSSYVTTLGDSYIEGTKSYEYINIGGNAETANKATKDSAGQQINTTYIKGLTASGTTLTITKGDGTTSTIKTQDTNTTYTTGTASTAGLTKLYTSTGSSTDGTMTRKAITDALATKSNVGHTHTADECGSLDESLKGAANGVAELDANGKVPSAQLPSFVDDVVEGYYSSSKFYSDSEKTKVITGEGGKIYVDLTSKKTYRWSGSAYAEISASLALGETSSTAYRGDRGKIAYTHSQATHAPSNAEKNIIVGIQKNGTDVAVDSSSRKVNITVPTKVSELENDSNFQSTIYTTGTSSTSGITKLYTETGTNVDGAMTQNAVTTELNTLNTNLTNGLAKKSDKGHTHNKAEIVDLNKALTNENLNSVMDVGWYYAGGNNSCTNKPANVDAFGLEVIRSANGWRTQKLYSSDGMNSVNAQKEFIRWYNASTWTSWVDMTVSANHTHSYLPLSGGTVTGTVTLSKTTDLSGAANNSPALIVGGGASSTHLEIDSNEIQAKTSGTTVAQLYLNNDGGLINVGSGGLKSNGTVTAPTFKGALTGNVTGNTDTATKLKTPKTIGISGGVTGTATSFDGSENITIPVTNVNASKITGYLGNNTYISSQPEGNGAVIPYIYNDLAFLKKRGGSYSVYTTTDTDYTAVSLTKASTLSWSLDNAFDSTPRYCQLTVPKVSDVVVIDIVLPQTYQYGTVFYYDAGENRWTAKNVSFYAYNTKNTSGTYSKIGGTTTASGYYKTKASPYYTVDGTTYQGFNRWRIVLTDFVMTTPRIAGLGIVNYDSMGLRYPFMSRGADDAVWRNITPSTSGTYNLGSSSNKWNGVYANTFTGSLSGNATSATKATQDSAGQQINTTYIKNAVKEGTLLTFTKGDGNTVSVETNVNVRGKDLNTIMDTGWYYAGGGNSCTNKPSGVDAFGLEVIRRADGGLPEQILYKNGSDTVFTRYYSGSAWTSWVEHSIFTPTMLTKLNGIATGAEVNVQSDWNATSGDAFIKNKPTIPKVVYETESLDFDLLV